MQRPEALAILARADSHEGDAIAVPRVHVGLDLEDEAGQLVLRRRDHALLGLARQRRRRMAHELVQQLLDAEIG